MFGAAAMSLSSFCVVTNALRLNLVRIHDDKRDKVRNAVDTAVFSDTVEEIQKHMQSDKEEQKMTKTFKISGMMCSNCEKHVKKALEALEGVTEAAPSHEKGEAVVEFSAEVSEDVIRSAVADAGYEYQGIA